jgi:hypothetical protein
MIDTTASAAITGWRLKASLALFMLSFIVPAAGVFLVTTLDLSTTLTATISGALLMAGELIGIAAVATMGKPGYQYIKTRIFGFLKRYGPPQEVGRARYNLGLIMFCIPIGFAWLSIYLADYLPGFAQDPLPYAIGGDILLLASLFVLGGDFWDKLRSLFVHNAIAKFPEPLRSTSVESDIARKA